MKFGKRRWEAKLEAKASDEESPAAPVAESWTVRTDPEHPDSVGPPIGEPEPEPVVEGEAVELPMTEVGVDDAAPVADEPLEEPLPDVAPEPETEYTPVPAADIEPERVPEPEPEPVAVEEPEPLPEGEPDQEDTDAADLLIIGGLSAEVKVVDEHPRYHLARCAWLAGKSTIPIAVSEARQLGFTPCVVCRPDAVLAARHRAGRGARQRKADV
jgi:hypothetical protein